jgi:hypothetical protein
MLRQAKLPLREALGQLREGGRQLEDFVAHELEQLEALRLELERREIAARAREEELRGTEQSLENQRLRLEQLRHTTEEYARKVQLQARRLSKQQEDEADGAASTNDKPSVKNDRSLLRQRNRLMKQLTSAQEQIGQLASSTLDLAATRGELAKANARIAKLQHRLAQQKGHFEPAMRQRLHENEIERMRLATQLEHAKTELADDHRQHDTAWLGELKQLRELIEERFTNSPSTDAWDAPSLVRPGDENLDRLIAQLDSMRLDLGAACDARR